MLTQIDTECGGRGVKLKVDLNVLHNRDWTISGYSKNDLKDKPGALVVWRGYNFAVVRQHKLFQGNIICYRT